MTPKIFRGKPFVLAPVTKCTRFFGLTKGSNGRHDFVWSLQKRNLSVTRSDVTTMDTGLSVLFLVRKSSELVPFKEYHPKVSRWASLLVMQASIDQPERIYHRKVVYFPTAPVWCTYVTL